MFSAMKEAMNDRGNCLSQQMCHVMMCIHTKMIVTTVKTRTVCELYKSAHKFMQRMEPELLFLALRLPLILLWQIVPPTHWPAWTSIPGDGSTR
jgi:hypothetical protein